jgi:K+-sensing histidine kinase KdpD
MQEKLRHKLPGQLKHVSVTQLISDVIEESKSEIGTRNLEVEFDDQLIEAKIDSELILVAFRALMKNAMESSPDESELTITMIDGPHHWEVEVADSSHHGRQKLNTEIEDQELSDPNEGLAVILPFPANENLRIAYRAAIEHGGQIQSWQCPQGGMAYVLVIPRRKFVNVA